MLMPFSQTLLLKHNIENAQSEIELTVSNIYSTGIPETDEIFLDLNREKQELKRLLKEEVDDVSTQNIPLFTLQMNIDEGLKSLRNKLQRRHDQIETYLLEQNNLCEGELNPIILWHYRKFIIIFLGFRAR